MIGTLLRTSLRSSVRASLIRIRAPFRQVQPHVYPTKDVINTVFRLGTSSTAFQTLYDGYRYFERRKAEATGFQAYVDTPTAWVGASDPIAPDSLQEDMILDFCSQAQKAGKAALLLPLKRELALVARKAGLFAIQIGNEPWFSLENFEAVGFLQDVFVAKRLKDKGATVESMDPLSISEWLREELDEIVERWLDSRASVPLSFLNRVEPWLYVNYKRYFRIHYRGQTLGFLSAVPVPARKAWYLVDLFRLPDAPAGTTELLIIEAMDELKRSGAREVTLGMSPLAQVSNEERSSHPRAYCLLDAIFRRSKSFYGFKSLYEYKDKFHPTRWEPLYLVVSPKLNAAALYGLFRALYPQGIVLTSLAFLWKKLRLMRLSTLYSKFLSDRLIPRPPPANFAEVLSRCKVVMTLTAANFLFFLASVDHSGQQIRPTMVARYGYSLKHFIEHGISLADAETIVLSSFLHENLLQLLGNTFLLLTLGGLIEIIAGSFIVCIAYLLGIIFSNLLASWVIHAALLCMNLTSSRTLYSTIDLGSSLGVFACLGVLAHFLQRKGRFIALLIAGALVQTIITRDILQYNHVFGLMIGLICGHFYVPKE